RRHTRCLSDWSSDVCSSDLQDDGNLVIRQANGTYIWDAGLGCTYTPTLPLGAYTKDGDHHNVNLLAQDGCPWTATSSVNWITIRSEERRVGKECRNRRWADR